MWYMIGFLIWLVVGFLVAAAKNLITGLNLESCMAVLFGPLFIFGDLIEVIADSITD
jgi:hypothetical protein